MKLEQNNWFWCPHCECVSYDYECECHATWCNAGGCDKCFPYHELVRVDKKNKNHPNIEFLKQKATDRWGKDMSEEQKILIEIFGEGE